METEGELPAKETGVPEAREAEESREEVQVDLETRDPSAPSVPEVSGMAKEFEASNGDAHPNPSSESGPSSESLKPNCGVEATNETAIVVLSEEQKRKKALTEIEAALEAERKKLKQNDLFIRITNQMRAGFMSNYKFLQLEDGTEWELRIKEWLMEEISLSEQQVVNDWALIKRHINRVMRQERATQVGRLKKTCLGTIVPGVDLQKPAAWTNPIQQLSTGRPRDPR